MGTFEASVKQFTIEAKENASLIFRTAADKLYKDVIVTKNNGGNLPHDTGNLGRSFAVSTVQFPEIDAGLASYRGNEAADSFTISGLDFGDTLYMGFQAIYALRQNYGFVEEDSLGRSYNQEGSYFVEKSAAKWQQFVTEAEAQFGE